MWLSFLTQRGASLWAQEVPLSPIEALGGQHTSLKAWVSLLAWEQGVPAVFLGVKGQ